MARLVYSMIASLDGFIEDEHGNFDWAEPDDEVFAFITGLEREVGTYLYGRRMYETMQAWETQPELAAHSPLLAEFAAAFKAADKIVYSTTLEAPSTARTRIERRFDPATVHELKANASRDITIGGPGLAAEAIRAGLVDEWQLFVIPIIVGGGKPWLPAGVRVALDLVEERRFASGTVYLRYAMP